MRIRIAAVGRLRDSAITDLVGRYTKRCKWPIEIVELVPKGRQTEAELLARACHGCERIVVLDEHGKNYSSQDFATHLSAWLDAGCQQTVFLIGGANGLEPSLREHATLVMAFGSATWPHMLVRVLLAEQIYRASCILSGHPYHRAG